MLTYLIAWLPLPFIGIINGAIRELTYKRNLGGTLGQQVSSVTAIIMISIYLGLLTSQWPIRSASQAFSIGIVWFCLTVAFEFLFGHFILGSSWDELTANYNVLAGKFWALIIIWPTVAPYIFCSIKNRQFRNQKKTKHENPSLRHCI